MFYKYYMYLRHQLNKLKQDYRKYWSILNDNIIQRVKRKEKLWWRAATTVVVIEIYG